MKEATSWTHYLSRHHARELKKPCIVGTKYATLLLEDGEKIEVNAKVEVVRKV